MHGERAITATPGMLLILHFSDNAKAAVSHFVATTRQYEEVEALPDMGKTMQ